MWIDEIVPGAKLTLITMLGTERFEFESIAQESYPKKHLILADVVRKDEKVISFHAKGLMVNLLTQPENDAPQLFKNVTITLVKKPDNTVCYSITSLAQSKVYNRREAFRCYVGTGTTVQCGTNKSAKDAILKDVSVTGFSVSCIADETNFHENQVLHVVLNDHLEESGEYFNFHLYGIIVRIEELENGRIVYGCRLNQKINGLDSYIVKKERARLKATHGSK